ncbi:MAG: hypothetical protein M3083_20385 [Actinomycetota bacterium]|nr:hypothetical protein [Actinomycetota bacterium]MDQ6945008.1 hypothetical protein [Actinomycetota bacterium]
MFFLGIPVYIWMKAQRGGFGESPVTAIEYPADSPYALNASSPTGAPPKGERNRNHVGALATAAAGPIEVRS